ncbi:hypothetical protein CCAX7_17770 [Capsulimonas corticalis]|uniref:Uncharacterized protein n=1 Tax=Capsulimonas corticalis TaxID=2219043 RepID=A0A402D3N9_9BACT|nr:hypothetical protein [Capsulimonas corticalis]BDI29726.1 hypothetical protein CCAX7_17770 [Capsulimonas corticalis]
MKDNQAEALAQFIKDHDKRYEAKAHREDTDSSVVLTAVVDGVPLEPITRIEQYRVQQIEENDPGPTVRAAWETWSSSEAARDE